MNQRAVVLALTALAAGSALTVPLRGAVADTRSGPVGFDAPVYVDFNVSGGEPSVMYDPFTHDYIYTAHEGTTLTDHDGVAGAPDSTAVWAGNYRNQVNVWTSPNGYTWTRVNFDGTGFTSNPSTNTGFSDPDLTIDAGGRVYDTGIDLANDALFSSTDGGKSWPVGTINCHDGDRPWLAGARRNEVFLATDPAESQLGHTIYRSTDGGASCGSTGIPDAGTIPKSSRLDRGDSYTGYGKLRYASTGPLRGALVDPIEVTNSSGAYVGIGVSVLRNADQAFATGRRPVPHVAAVTHGLLTLMPAISLDSAGNIYLVWADDPTDRAGNPTGLNKVYLDESADGGRSWLPKPLVVAAASRIAGPHRGTVLWPWVAAGSTGNVSVVWYQYDRVVPNPDQATCDCAVSVMDANLYGVGTDHLTRYVVDAAGRPIHYGGICQSGTTCVATGQDRRLGDYFTNNLDGNGCVIIATGDTTKLDPITGQQRAWSLPLFLHQDTGPSLTGKTCRPPSGG
jgi:hypothetical protein